MMVHMPYMKTLLYNSRVMCICCRPKCIGGILDRVACPPNTANTQSISNTVSTTTPPTHETVTSELVAAATATITTTTTTTTTTTATSTATYIIRNDIEMSRDGFISATEPLEYDDYVII